MKYNETLHEKIIRLVESGMSLSESARLMKLSPPSVWRWHRLGREDESSKYRSFFEDVEFAKAKSIQDRMERVSADPKAGPRLDERLLLLDRERLERQDEADAKEAGYKRFKEIVLIDESNTNMGDAFDLVAVRGVPIDRAVEQCSVADNDRTRGTLRKAETWYMMTLLDAVHGGCRTSLDLLARRFPSKYAGTSPRSVYDAEPAPVSEKDRYHKMRIKALMRGEESNAALSDSQRGVGESSEKPQDVPEVEADPVDDGTPVLQDIGDVASEPQDVPAGEETPTERKRRLLAIHYGDDDWHELDAQDKADRDRFISQLDIFAPDFDKRFFEERARINVELGKKIKL